MRKIFTLLCGALFAAQFTSVSAQSTTKMKVYKTDGSVVEYATSEVDSVSFSTTLPSCYIIDGHKFIDLGLSVLWAETNVGASSEAESEYGSYYQWFDAQNALSSGWSSCRLPTEREMDELINNCNLTWTSVNGVYGCRFTSTKNSNSIFLPAAGYKFSPTSSADGVGLKCRYWSGTEDGRESLYLDLQEGTYICWWDTKYCCYSIRAVYQKQ